MFEIRFHGRGGQGAVTAAEILALAAFSEGNYAQSFPQFGVERRGAPVAAFCRVSDKKILLHSNIYQPDCVVLFDISLLKTPKTIAGLKENGWLILNTDQNPENFSYLLLGLNGVEGYFSKIATVDATAIAARHKLGSETAPIVNTTILGAVVRATGILKKDSLINAMAGKIDKKLSDNCSAYEDAYSMTKIFTGPPASLCEALRAGKGGEENASD